MDYKVQFNFNCVNKRSLVSGKSGEVNITSEATQDELKSSNELIGLIALEMEKKTKQSVISVDITKISAQ